MFLLGKFWDIDNLGEKFLRKDRSIRFVLRKILGWEIGTIFTFNFVRLSREAAVRKSSYYFSLMGDAYAKLWVWLIRIVSLDSVFHVSQIIFIRINPVTVLVADWLISVWTKALTRHVCTISIIYYGSSKSLCGDVTTAYKKGCAEV